MNRLRLLLDNRAPTVAGVVTSPEDVAEVAAAEPGELLHVAELRADLFEGASREEIVTVLHQIGKFPTLLTIRDSSEGGEWRGSPDERAFAYARLMGQIDGVDVEARSPIARSVIKVAQQFGVVSIASYHDTEKTPSLPDLQAVVEEAAATGADCIKVATRATTFAEYERLQRLLSGATYPLIVLAMGDYGPVSRKLFPRLGSCMTYGSVGQRGLVPGQPTAQSLMEHFRSSVHLHADPSER